MKKKFLVTIEIPVGVDTIDMEEYIKEAVRVWAGRYHTSPMFHLKKKSVKVQLLTDRTINSLKVKDYVK